MANNNIIIDDEKFEGTPGLWELIVSKKPNEFVNKDNDNYANLMVKSNALHQGNNPNNPRLKSSGGYKWEILKYIWRDREKVEGEGVVIIPSVVRKIRPLAR